MADQLDEIRSKVNLVDLVGEYIPLKKTGRNFKALCPFHSEKMPSFIVSPERQIFKCFGCGAGGDIFKFLMLTENVDFGEALRALAKRAGVKLHRYRPSEAEKQKDLLYEVNHLASEFYHFLLFNHPIGKRALDYILGRGITRESLQLFKLGFAPDLWDSLQKFLVGKKGYRLELLDQAGLVIKSEKGRGFYDRFRGRLMFPLRDHRGNVAGFAGRVLKPGQEEAKYINTPETAIYHKSDLLYGLTETKEAVKKAERVILMEGELDVISSYQVGIKNAVAIKGSALTPSQVRLISRFTKNIVFAFDRDKSGDLATHRGIEVADAAEMAIEVIQLEGGKDVDEIAQKDPDFWRRLVKKPVPVYDYFLDSAAARFDAHTAEGKRKIGQEFIPILAKISNEIVQAHYVEKLAKKLAVPTDSIMAEIDKIETTEATAPSLPVEPEEKKSRREILEEHLLALCFQSGHWSYLKKRRLASLIETPRLGHILEVLTKYLKRYKTCESQRLAKMLPAELVTSFDQLYLLGLEDLVSSEEDFEKELGKTLSQLEKLDFKEGLKTLSREIGDLEDQEEISQADKKTLSSHYQKFKDLSTKLAELEAKE